MASATSLRPVPVEFLVHVDDFRSHRIPGLPNSKVGSCFIRAMNSSSTWTLTHGSQSILECRLEARKTSLRGTSCAAFRTPCEKRLRTSL